MLKIAQHQADPMIARIILEGKADAVLSSDSNYSVYLGHRCLCIKHYEYRATYSTINKITLSTGDKVMADRVDGCLRKLFQNLNHKFAQPEFPLFSGEDDPLFRALIAVVLGCNVYPGGVKGLGPSKVHDLLTTLKKEINNNTEKLLMMITKNEDDHAALKTLAMAFCYEPCNDESQSDIQPIYLYKKPASLQEYLSEYAPLDGSVSIEKGPPYRICKGFCWNKHKFLEFDGVYLCSTCASMVC